jgi:purine-cytosine permease-like protein
MNAADIGPVPPENRTQPASDLFLIFAGANIVATTLVTGASLVPAFSAGNAVALIAAGSVLGAALVAALAPVGPRLGAPSVIAARAALGLRGAQLLAVFLYVTNFAWIALNNVIAASACAQVVGGPEREGVWAALLGILATAMVALGPRAVARADRIAVPVMLVLCGLLLLQVLRLPREAILAPATGGLAPLRGLDIVVGYQVSWILMFADYSRYTRSQTGSAVAVFGALAATSFFVMGVGALGAKAAGTSDPGGILSRLGFGAAGALLLALATVTTNFVNIYLSALSWKSLVPRTSQAWAVWSIGGIGTLLGLLSRDWLQRYVDFMLLLGGSLVPVGGILLARFFLIRADVDVASLYESPDRLSRWGLPALVAWLLGAATYYALADVGGTLPCLAVSVGTYYLLASRAPSEAA